MAARAKSVTASSATSIDPNARRQRILCHQGMRIAFSSSYPGSARPRSQVKFVAYAPNCLDVALLGVGLYFFAQGADMHINGVAVAEIVVAPYFVHEDFTREHAIRGLRQQSQQVN